MGIFNRTKDDSTLIRESKEKFINNVIEHMKSSNQDEALFNNVIDFAKRKNSIRELYGDVIVATLEHTVKEFTIVNGSPRAMLGYSTNNLDNADNCLHKILREHSSDLEADYRYVILFTISYLETVCKNYSNEFDKKITGKNIPPSLAEAFGNSMSFYQSWIKLEQSSSIVHLENFAKKFIDTGYNVDEISKLTKLIQHTGLDVDYGIIKQILQHIELSLRRDRMEMSMRDANPQTLMDYLNTYIVMYGDQYLEYIDVFDQLLQKKDIAYMGTLRSNVEAKLKYNEMKKYAQSLQEPVHKKSNTLQILDQMTNREFEDFLKHLFEKMGYTVDVKAKDDQGTDFILSKMGEKTVVQAKQYSNVVPNTAVKELTEAIKHYKAYNGMMVSSNDFQPSDVKLANSSGIKLIGRNELSEWIDSYM